MRAAPPCNSALHARHHPRQQVVPTDPEEARQRLADTEAQLQELEVQHRVIKRAAGRWPRFWLQVGRCWFAGVLMWWFWWVGVCGASGAGGACVLVLVSRCLWCWCAGVVVLVWWCADVGVLGQLTQFLLRIPSLAGLSFQILIQQHPHTTKHVQKIHRHQKAGCLALFTQLVGFAYLTWWELSWDVMEPIAYMISLSYRCEPRLGVGI